MIAATFEPNVSFAMKELCMALSASTSRAACTCGSLNIFPALKGEDFRPLEGDVPPRPQNVQRQHVGYAARSAELCCGAGDGDDPGGKALLQSALGTREG